MLTAPNLMQHELPGVPHTGDPLARQYARIPWMSRQLAMRYYAGIFAIYEPRDGGESESWLDTYQRLRRTMGMTWMNPLRDEFKRPYPAPINP